MEKIKRVALAITIIGALNWGVVGLFSYDVVAQFAGGYAKPLARFFFVLIGISGLLSLGLLFEHWRYEERENNTLAGTEEA